MKRYKQLTIEQRYQISAFRKAGMSMAKIGKHVGVDISCISRELSRNSTLKGYDPKVAHRLSVTRKRTSKKSSKRHEKTDDIISKCAKLNWSPETISIRLSVEFDESVSLSHTTIYRRIEEDKQQGGLLYRQLPRFGKTRWKGGNSL